jgi:hypothetical protein
MHGIVLVLISLFLVGCSPVYVTKNHYIAPQKKDFSLHVNRCEEKKKICDVKCNEDYQNCLDRAYFRAKNIFTQQSAKYEVESRLYRTELREYKHYKYQFDNNYMEIHRDYSHFSKQCNSKKSSFTCRRKNELKDTLSMMKLQMMQKPQKPKKPSFDKILKNQQSFCQSNCGCSESFDICYVSSGGEVIPYKMCLRNCD